MDFDIQMFDLPDFGLMTKADKQKLDGIDTSTLLTKTEAAATYATIEYVKGYIKQVIESDTGYVFINGNNSEVGLIPAFTKPSPELTLSGPFSTTTPYTMNITETSMGGSQNITVTRLGDGAITFTCASGELTASVNGTVITVTNASLARGSSTTFTISVAESDSYAAESVEVSVTCSGIAAPT